MKRRQQYWILLYPEVLQDEAEKNIVLTKWVLAFKKVIFLYYIFWMPRIKQEWSASRLQSLRILKAIDENDPGTVIVNKSRDCKRLWAVAQMFSAQICFRNNIKAPDVCCQNNCLMSFSCGFYSDLLSLNIQNYSRFF